PVSMVRIHVCVDLEYKTRKLLFLRHHLTDISLAALGSRSDLDKSIQHLIDAEVIYRRAEEYGSDLSVQIFIHIKIRVHSFDQIHIFTELLDIARSDQAVELRIVQVFKFLSVIAELSLRRCEKIESFFVEIIDPLESFTHADWPRKWPDADSQFSLYFIQQIVRIPTFTVEFIDKADH